MSSKNFLQHKPAQSADYDKLIHIWERSVESTHDFLSQSDFESIRRDLPSYFQQVELLKWIKSTGEIVGFSGTSGHELIMLFLDPNYFRNGYGHLIIHILIEEFEIDQVSVNEQNLGATAFYERQGFKIESRNAVDNEGRSYPILNLHLKKYDV